MDNTSSDLVRDDILLSRAAFEKAQDPKHAMMPSEFNARFKSAEQAIIGLDTDAFDVRQQMEPLFDNPHLNHAQRMRVMILRYKLLKCLIEHGFIDGWGIAAPAPEELVAMQ